MSTSSLWNHHVAPQSNREQQRKEKPLRQDDFPLHVEGDKIKKHDGMPLASTEDPATAADMANRFNEDEDRREEDKWSA